MIGGHSEVAFAKDEIKKEAAAPAITVEASKRLEIRYVVRFRIPSISKASVPRLQYQLLEYSASGDYAWASPLSFLQWAGLLQLSLFVR